MMTDRPVTCTRMCDKLDLPQFEGVAGRATRLGRVNDMTMALGNCAAEFAGWTISLGARVDAILAAAAPREPRARPMAKVELTLVANSARDRLPSLGVRPLRI